MGGAAVLICILRKKKEEEEGENGANVGFNTFKFTDKIFKRILR